MRWREIVIDRKDIAFLQKEIFILLRDVRRAMRSDKREPSVILHNCGFVLGIAFVAVEMGVISYATERRITDWVERRMYEVQHGK